MKKLLLLLLLFAPAVYALEVTLSWTNATQNEDGTQIPATGPLAFHLTDATTIAYGLCDGAGDVAPPITLVSFPPAATGTTVSAAAAGDWCFKAFHKNQNNTVSVFSNVATKTVLPTAPQPPVLIVVDTVVYDILKRPDAILFLAVGTVPPDTECDPANSAQGMGDTKYAVPKALVTWFGTVEPDVVVADCS